MLNRSPQTVAVKHRQLFAPACNERSMCPLCTAITQDVRYRKDIADKAPGPVGEEALELCDLRSSLGTRRTFGCMWRKEVRSW